VEGRSMINEYSATARTAAEMGALLEVMLGESM
jgi:hypothetical protein